MKRSATLAILIIFTFALGCEPNDNQPEIIPLIDSSLTNPDFSSTLVDPNLGIDEFCFAKTSTGVSIFCSYSNYLDGGIYEIKFSGTTPTAKTLIDSSVYGVPSVDAVYDNTYSRTRLAYFYNYPNWTDPDPIMVGSYSSGSLNGFEIDGKRNNKVKIAMIDEATNTYIVTSNTEDYLSYKFVSFTGVESHSITPPYIFGTGNSITLFDNNMSIQLRETRLAYNHQSSSTLVGCNFISSSTNYFQVVNANGAVGPYKLINKYNFGNAPEFDIAPIGEYFLVAYSSNLKISEQNLGNNVQCGEHIRLALINSNGTNENLTVGSQNPDYSLVEKAVALPQVIGDNNEIANICMARKNDNEVGLSFLRDGNIYFTRIVLTGTQLSISPIKLLQSNIDMVYGSQMKMYFDGNYYIAYYGPVFLITDALCTFVAS